MTGQIRIDNPAVLVDEPVNLTVVGCTPGETVVLRAAWSIGDERVQSEGQFVVPSDGIVDPAQAPSVGGTYTGVEPYGLWWSIAASEIPDDPDELGSWPVSITAAGRDWDAAGTLVRRKLDPSVQALPVRSGRLRGIFFLPDHQGRLPAVIVFSGSGGGLGGVTSAAALLASHGFAVLALAYFRYDDLPADLAEIPLEYFFEAIEWLKTEVPSPVGSIGVMGASRGGELALLLGSTYPEQISAVVAKVPSGVVWSGISRDPARNPVAWTIGGRPITPMKGYPRDPAGLPIRDGGIALTPGFEARLAASSSEDLAAAEIPVERCGGPVLLLSAEDDAMWPSTTLAEIAVRRARTHGLQHPIRHISYPDAGHTLGTPAGFPIPLRSVHPVRGGTYAYGGSLAGNAHASVDSWGEILSFLHSSLAAPPEGCV
jgi:pimeloyl-ACP methyl ester carboxylesterase